MSEKLHLGCGRDKRDGFLNIDIAEEVNPDKAWDLEKGLPFLDDNSVDYILSNHTLEHLTTKGYWNLLEEMYRVSKDGARWELCLPFDNPETRANSEHVRTFSYHSFSNYCANSDTFRDYYRIKLERFRDKPTKVTRLFFSIFSLLKYEIRYKFEVVK